MVLPARIDTTSVPAPASGAMEGAAASSICGLMARTSAAGAGPTSADRPTWGRARRHRAAGMEVDALRGAESAHPGRGCGSTMVVAAGSRPRASQPSSMAPPILPAPTRTREAGSDGVMAAPGSTLRDWPQLAERYGQRPSLMASRRRAVDRVRRAGGQRQASPSVSNSTLSSASRALLPAQSTNWKAW